jgi:hypothetical protein
MDAVNKGQIFGLEKKSQIIKDDELCTVPTCYLFYKAFRLRALTKRRSSTRVSFHICTIVRTVYITLFDVQLYPKKIYRLKEDQAFWLSLELGRRDKVARHPSAEFLPLPPVPSFV